ncbi:MAG: helix-turn-helix domain-containing protein [Chelatococcus sp.]|uniref:helix-turn-helix domain-containing protein n=1 Tax=Chelatococcus sp. TaxID=1953771 RepID=UPI001EBEBEF2|nr:helix-turn-helix domain-containing protein [Chelatococcus sp.]MBX3537324.1 helix-turn-helix domain-containing protein [Chelatococcus sp.]MBX3546885.1 helix-turn-helix domain-containing protein [Chelatococcus sp.]
MTPEQFKAWRKHLKLSQPEAAAVLGISPGSVFNYEKGARSEDGRPVLIPKTVELACAAVALGIRDYDGPQS